MLHRQGFAVALVLLLAGLAAGDVVSPPPPESYFNDYAGFVPADVARRLDDTLRRFDEETTSQVVVAVFPKLPAASLEDFTARTAQAWRVGRADLDNGAVLFVFVQDRKLRLEVGYGLEDKIPDAVAKRIIDDVIVLRFRAGDPAGGLTAGIDAILAAARGHTAAPAAAPVRPAPPAPSSSQDWSRHSLFLFMMVAILAIGAWMRGRGPQSSTYSRRSQLQTGQVPNGGCLSVLGVLGGLAGYLSLGGLSTEAKLAIFLVALFLGVVGLVLWAAAKGEGSGGSGWSSGGGYSGGWASSHWGSSGGGSSGGGFSGGGGSFGGGGASGSW